MTHRLLEYHKKMVGETIAAFEQAKVTCHELYSVIRSRPFKGKAQEESQILLHMVTRIDDVLTMLRADTDQVKTLMEGQPS